MLEMYQRERERSLSPPPVSIETQNLHARPETNQKTPHSPRPREGKERGSGSKSKREKSERDYLGGNVVVQKGVFSFPSAGIDAMTHWAATVPAETKKKKVRLPRPKEGKERGREVKIKKARKTAANGARSKRGGGMGKRPPTS